MKDFKARSVFAIYCAVGCLLSIILRSYFYLFFWQKKAQRQILASRLALDGKKKSKAPLIWVHGSSVGEIAGLVPLIEKLRTKKFQILVTTSTTNAAIFVQKRLAGRVIHRYAPLDFPPVVERFLNHWEPSLVLVGEAEIWPVRILELYKRKILQISVSAHMSTRSYQKWSKYKSLSHYIFSKFDLCLCQTKQDSERYAALGVKSVKVTGNLKAEAPPIFDEKVVAPYKKAIANRPVWAAISTHKGEELIAAEIHKALKPHFEDLLTIIVPRYLNDIETVSADLRAKGFTLAQRSKNEPLNQEVDIFLGDTIGEMGFYLALTDIVFIGKSLTERGGHNPLEPALLHKAILSGPYVENFQEIYDKMQKYKAVLIINNATELASMVNRLLTQKHALTRLQKNAAQSIEHLGGVVEKTFKALDPFLEPIILQLGLNNVRQDKY